MVIICSRCGAEVGNILDHYDEHHGMPVAKVRDYRVFWDEPEPHPITSWTPVAVYMRDYRAKNRDRINARRRERYVERRSEICDT